MNEGLAGEERSSKEKRSHAVGVVGTTETLRVELLPTQMIFG